MKTDTIEFLQNDGAAETLKAASAEFEVRHPGRKAISAEFEWLSPGDRDGRWVGIKVTYEDKS